MEIQDREQTALARVLTASPAGVGASLVTVEVARSNGLPRQTIVGLPGSAVRESLDRVHAACAHCGVALRPRRTTINLAPAGRRKSGPGLDLAIALGLLVADEVVPPERLEATLCLGELALDGVVRPVVGALPAALTARDLGMRALLVPPDNAAEAAAVPGLAVLPIPTLAGAIEWARGAEVTPWPAAAEAGHAPTAAVDLATVRGQPIAKRALEVAAAGGHHLLMSGPPGAGKTLLARALPGVLPRLSFDEALEASAVHSVVGGLRRRGLLVERPFRAPHHAVSTAGLIGGGVPLRPGEISLAHHGVLFMDELPEFRRAALEALRQPLETGVVELVRANESHTFPARFQLLAAMNECPCGRGPHNPECRCGEFEVARYQRKVSGPLLDRIDLYVTVERTPLTSLVEEEHEETSSEVRARIETARTRQWKRNSGLADLPPPALNSTLPGADLADLCRVPRSVLELARTAADDLDLSARAWHRMLRVARTVADLQAADDVDEPHVLEALCYRRS